MRLPESHGATTLWEGSSPLLVNLSVRESYEALQRLRHLRAYGPSPPGLHPAAALRAGRTAGDAAAAQSELRASVAAWPAVVVRRRNPARRVSSSSL
jgi:hypothetical protein